MKQHTALFICDEYYCENSVLILKRKQVIF